MAKLTLTDISSGYGLTTTLNANNALIEAAIENTISRDGTSPNTMSANIDMNSNKLVNLADGTSAQDAVTLSQLEAVTGQTVVGFLTEIVQDTSPELGGNLSTGSSDINVSAGSQINFTTGASAGGLYHDGVDLLVQSGDGDITLTSAANANVNAAYTTFSGNIELPDNKHIGFGAGGGSGLNDYDVRIVWNSTAGELQFVSGSGVSDQPVLIDETISEFRIKAPITNFNDNVVQRPKFKDYGLTSTTPTSTSGAITFDLSAGNAFQVTLTENITAITLSNPPATGTYGECIIKFVQDGTGSRTVAGWPAAVKWATGSAPTITTTATTGTDIITLKTWDAGTTWFGDYSQDYS